MKKKSELKNKKMLIIALVNEFDLVSFLPVYQNYHSKKYGITLLVKKTAKALTPFLKNVDRILFFDDNKLKDRINDNSYSLVEKYNFLADYLYELTSDSFELVVNLSHNQTSANIVSLLNYNSVIGFYFSDNNNKEISGDWIQTFYASINADRYNPYSHYDLILSQFNYNKKEIPPVLNMDMSLEPLYEKVRDRFNVKENELVLISCASRSDLQNRWHLESIIELANLCIKNNEKVVVFSGPEEEKALRYVESYVNKKVVCEIMNVLDLSIFMKYTKVIVSQTMNALSISSAMNVPIVYLNIKEVNFRENIQTVEGDFIIDSSSTRVPGDFIYSIISAINSSYIDKIITNREELQDVPIDIPNGYSCYFTRFDKDGFIRFDSLSKLAINKETLYLELYRELWKIINLEKITQDAFNDFIDVLKNNYQRHQILAAIAFAKYDIGTLGLFKELNKKNMEILGGMLHKKHDEEKLDLVEKTNKETMMLFNKNPFLLIIKFYFLILYENIKRKPREIFIEQMFDFCLRLDKIFSFMIFCLTQTNEVIFDDYNVLDEVVNGEDSMIYN